MTSEMKDGDSWERVAAELRACKEAQQRAWGDIDNTTIGRYLAGEVSPDERGEIERALAALPALRELTDLVRDVLGDVPAAAPYGPAVLPFPQPQARPASARTLPATTPRPRGWRTWAGDTRSRQRGALVAAACLLLALTVTLPRTETPPSDAGPSLTFVRPTAERTQLADDEMLFARFDAEEPQRLGADREEARRLRAYGRADANERRVATERVPAQREYLQAKRGLPQVAAARRDEARKDVPPERFVASVQALEADGKKREAEVLARLYASNLTRKALVYWEKGDVEQAEPAMCEARQFCARTLGPEAPETVRVNQSLAGVYEVALNTAPPVRPSVPADELPLALKKADRAAEAKTPGATPSPVRVFSAYEPAAPPQTEQDTLPTRPTARDHARRTPPATSHGYAHHGGRATGGRAAHLHERITQQSREKLKTAVVPVLAGALRAAPDAGERLRLARALAQLGPAARDAAPALLDCCCRAADDAERAALLRSLEQLGPTARRCAGALVRQHPDDPLVRDVVRRLDCPQGRSGVDDRAECFSVVALRQAQTDVLHLAASFASDVVIETVSGNESEDGRDPTPARGVRVRIRADQARAEVWVSDDLRRHGVSEAGLTRLMGPYLARKDFDGGLRAGVWFLSRHAKRAEK